MVWVLMYYLLHLFKAVQLSLKELICFILNCSSNLLVSLWLTRAEQYIFPARTYFFSLACGHRSFWNHQESPDDSIKHFFILLIMSMYSLVFFLEKITYAILVRLSTINYKHDPLNNFFSTAKPTTCGFPHIKSCGLCL